MSELLKCPFCGGKAELYDYEATRDIYDSHTLGYVDTEYFTKYGVACSECNCMMAEYKSEESAIKAWNTRKPTPMQKVLERLWQQVEQERQSYNEFEDGEYYSAMTAYQHAIEIIKEEGQI